MIGDNTLVLSDSQAITATARSTNVIDLGATGTAYGAAAALSRDVGKGDDIPLVVEVTEAFNTLTSLKVSLESDDNAAFSSAREIASRTYLLAELTLGAVLSFPAELPEGTNERYLSLNYTVAGSNPTTGKLFASIVAGRQTNP
jgi:hypothetical protein